MSIPLNTMPSPRKKIDDILTAAQRTPDAATVIALYCNHLERLLRDHYAADPYDPGICQEEWSAENYLAAEARERVEVIGDAINEDTVNQEIKMLMDIHVLFQHLDSLMLFRKRIQDGEGGFPLDARIREFYDEICWLLEERALDESVPAGQIIRYLFEHAIHEADTYLRGGIQVNQESAVLEMAEAIAQEEFAQRFTPPSLREFCCSDSAMPGRLPRRGIRRMKSPVRRAGSVRRRSWRRRF